MNDYERRILYAYLRQYFNREVQVDLFTYIEENQADRINTLRCETHEQDWENRFRNECKNFVGSFFIDLNNANKNEFINRFCLLVRELCIVRMQTSTTSRQRFDDLFSWLVSLFQAQRELVFESPSVQLARLTLRDRIELIDNIIRELCKIFLNNANPQDLCKYFIQHLQEISEQNDGQRLGNYRQRLDYLVRQLRAGLFRCFLGYSMRDPHFRDRNYSDHIATLLFGEYNRTYFTILNEAGFPYNNRTDARDVTRDLIRHYRRYCYEEDLWFVNV